MLRTLIPQAKSASAKEIATKRIPVSLITGFLGAGKSTLINRFISSFPDRRFAIIVNEFGEVPLESRLIEAQKGDIIEFSNGCMCCVARNDLMRAVGLLARRKKRFDHLIVEASGLSDPVPVVRSFLHAPDRFAVHSMICVVDAENFFDTREPFPVADLQVRFADFVLITKWQTVPVERLDALERVISGIREGIPIVRLDSGTELELYLDEFDGAGWLNAGPPDNRSPVEVASDRGSAHNVVPHCSLRSDRPIDPDAFRIFIEALPEGIVRGKGVVRFSGRDGRRYKSILQIVGTRRSLSAVPWKRFEPRRTDLLFVGIGLDPEKLARRFEELCRGSV